MAGDWLKLEKSLPDKPEVHAIAGMLDMDPDLVAMKLFRVWCWFDEHTENGNAFGVTYALVDRTTGVTGFGEAMNFVGWLEQDGMNLILPNFDRHNGETAKKRALNAKRTAKHREKSNAKSNATSVTDAAPREEKRRDKEKINKKKFTPPSAEEVREYCQARGNDIDPEKFVDFYTSKGWKVGNNPMKDWKAAVRTWENKQKSQSADFDPREYYVS